MSAGSPHSRVFLAQRAFKSVTPPWKHHPKPACLGVLENGIERPSHSACSASAIYRHDLGRRADQPDDLASELVPGAGALVDQVIDPRRHARMRREGVHRATEVV